MKISFLIPAIVLYVVRVAFSNSVQVGTVLFTTRDLVRKCWTKNDKSLLKARLIMQDVLPDPDCIDFSNPETVVILLEYFHTCFQIINTSTYGRIQNMMYLALSDTLGGYLRAYVLPFTKRAYYAGQVKYSEASQLFLLYDDIKNFLRTNGLGWAEPQKLPIKKVRAVPLVITGGALEACKELYIIEKEGKIHCINSKNCFERLDDDDDHDYSDVYVDDDDESLSNDIKKDFKESFRESIPPKNSKRRSNSSSVPKNFSTEYSKNSAVKENHEKLNFNVQNISKKSLNFIKNFTKVTKLLPEDEKPGRRKYRCECESSCGKTNDPFKRVIVPLPVLDDCVAPNSIAVPFKRRPFLNLKTGCSAYILQYYYVAVIKCFIAKGNTRTDIKNFNAKFHCWLVSQVLPHLEEEQWYPGFGGVLRIMETIKKLGKENTIKDPLMHEIGFMFNSGAEIRMNDNSQKKGKEKARDVNDVEENSYSKRHVITAILIVSVLWMFAFCACAFYVQATRGQTLMYEGCGEAANQPKPTHTRTHPNKENFINFHFIVKFFKKKEEPPESAEQRCLELNKPKPKCPERQNLCEEKLHCKETTDFRKQDCNRIEKEQTFICGQGDFPFFKLPKLEEKFNSVLTTWPNQPCSIPINQVELVKPEIRPGGDCSQIEPQDVRAKVQTLWKKPSTKFRRHVVLKEGREGKPQKKGKNTKRRATSEDTFGRTSYSYTATADDTKGYSTEMLSSTCCCSDSCQHSHTTATSSSSATQVEEKLSSATMEFFDEVIKKRKPRRKSAKKNTTESESKDEGSSTSESY